jgi:hypothetical protein
MPDPEAYNLALKKLLDLIARFEQFNKFRKSLDDEEAIMRQDWTAWYHIYEREKPPEEQTSLPLDGETAPEPAGESVPQSSDLFEMKSPLPSEPTQQPTVDEFGEKFSQRTYGSKTLKVITALQEAGESGVTPKELKDALLRLEVSASDGFANNALFRLKKQKKVKVLPNGRYVLIENLPSKEAA